MIGLSPPKHMRKKAFKKLSRKELEALLFIEVTAYNE